MIKVDFHLHTSASEDCKHSVRQMLWEALRKGMQAVAITDHNTTSALDEAKRIAKEKKLVIIPGEEVSTAEGHILALGITKGIEPLLPALKTIKLIHKAGGIAIAAHPFDKRRNGIGDLVYTLPLDGIEVANGRSVGQRGKAQKAAEMLSLPRIGGSDAHSKPEVANAYTLVDSDLKVTSILDAVLKKRVKMVYGSRLKALISPIRRRL